MNIYPSNVRYVMNTRTSLNPTKIKYNKKKNKSKEKNGTKSIDERGTKQI